jgi:secreted trypsin-like serine protease
MIGKGLAFAIMGLIAPSSASYAQEEIRPFDRRIIGCEPTQISKHPWQVAFNVTFPDGKTYLCGGSIIHKNWVLTAAHCFDAKSNPSDGVVKSGVTNIVTSGDWVEIAEFVRHKAYNPKTHENDIALVRLKNSPKGKEIGLIGYEAKLAPGQVLEVTGWGLTEKGTTSDTLCKTTVPYVEYATCNAKESYNGGIHTGMLCAGYPKGGKDSCGGDGGRPLVWYLNSKPTLVGVVSFGQGCALTNTYGVYTRVSAYRDWIDEIIGNDKD